MKLYRLFLFMLVFVGMAMIFLSMWWANNHIEKLCRARCISDIDLIPYNEVGLVLGTAPYTKRGMNPYFLTRIDAAAELYHAGKVRYLLVSGDNGSRHYDEVTAMKEALIQRGVPAADVYMDHAGFRTLDSIVRAKKVFMQNNVTVISQPFHNARALYVAKAYGLDQTYAYNAQNVKSPRSLYYANLREKMARVKAVLDIKVLHVQPRFLGEAIIIGGDRDKVETELKAESDREDTVIDSGVS